MALDDAILAVSSVVGLKNHHFHCHNSSLSLSAPPRLFFLVETNFIYSSNGRKCLGIRSIFIIGRECISPVCSNIRLSKENPPPSINNKAYKGLDSDSNSQMLPLVSSKVEKMVGVEANSDNCLLVDDLYFSALFDDEEKFPISDEKYAEELQLQEALMSSAISSRVRMGSTDLLASQHFNSSKKGKEIETGMTSNSQSDQGTSSLCLICMDVKPMGEMFRSNTCAHLFCTDCIGKYIATKLQEQISTIECPALNCTGALEPQFCRSIVPGEVFHRWENALCESLVLASQKLYCPFRDCSAMLVDDGGDNVVQSECPNCHRLFCARCKVAWHTGISCNEFQNLKNDERSREDIMVIELAKKKMWRRCPNCEIYVEKIDGCSHVSCRCGCQFCYGCGDRWLSTHHCRR